MTLDRIFEIGWKQHEQLVCAERAHNVMVWLLVGHRLGSPWRELSFSIITGRHRVSVPR